VVQPVSQLAERQRPQLDRRQLDRQRDAVEPPADPDDVRRVLRGNREVRHRARGPQREQFHRVPAVGPAGAGPGQPVVLRHRQRPDRKGVLAGHVERLLRGGEHGHAGSIPHDGLGERGAGVEQVLARVEDQQQPPVPQVLEQRVERGARVLLGQAEHARDRVGQQRGVAQVRQLDDPGAVRVADGCLCGRDERDPRLADPARSDDRHDPGVREHRGDPREFALPAYEVGVLVLWK
jgi:hypothetical protein